MPQWGNQDYKSAVFEQLSKGSGGDDQDHFEHFANFSAGAPRRDVEAGVGEAMHPEAVPPDQMEPQLRDAASKMQPGERSEIATDLMDELKQRGLAPTWLQKMLGLGSAVGVGVGVGPGVGVADGVGVGVGVGSARSPGTPAGRSSPDGSPGCATAYARRISPAITSSTSTSAGPLRSGGRAVTCGPRARRRRRRRAARRCWCGS